MSYSRFSEYIAGHMSSELKLDEEKRNIMAYSVESIILTILGFVLIVFVGFLFGAAFEAAAAALSGGFLRRLSGGAHAKTAQRCLIFGAISYGILGWLASFINYKYAPDLILLLIPFAISFTIAAVYAPVDCSAKPINSPVLRKRLKTASLVYLFVLGVFSVFLFPDAIGVSAALGAIYQSITLFPILNEGRC